MKDMRGLGTALPKRGGGKKAPQEEDEEDDGDYQPTEAERKLIAEALKSNNPALMAALNAKLNSMVGKSSGYLDTLPSKVRPWLQPAKSTATATPARRTWALFLCRDTGT